MVYIKLLKGKIDDYLKRCTLHGLKYVGKQHLSWMERLFWLSAFIVAVSLSSYFIITIINNYNNGIIISINPNPSNADDLPFPTITICDMNRANKNRAINLNGTTDNKCLSILCGSEYNHQDVKGFIVKPSHVEQERFINFTNKISPTCDEMIKLCFWMRKEFDCKDIFAPVITDVGVCCSFNHLPLNTIFREMNYADILEDQRPYDAEKWNFEVGYSENATNETIPWRLKGSGLTVIMKTDIDNYYCSSTNSAGFKLLISDPLEVPMVQEFAIHIIPGYQIEVALSPFITDAKGSLTHETATNRRCYFNDERKLKFYKVYSMHNCFVECQVNYTLQKCNCIPYYALSDTTTKICDRQHKPCQDQVLGSVSYSERPFQQKSLCNCLPNCNEYVFSERKSYSRITQKWLRRKFPQIKKVIGNETIEDFVRGLAILKLYSAKYFVNRSTKNEIYDDLELLSNMGGILSIFLGFSFLSAIEIVYHFVSEIIPILMQFLKDNRGERETKVLPFAK